MIFISPHEKTSVFSRTETQQVVQTIVNVVFFDFIKLREHDTIVLDTTKRVREAHPGTGEKQQNMYFIVWWMF